MKQEKEKYCLCAVLQEIFLDYGLNLSQTEIANKLTPAKKGFRVDDNKIKEFMEHQGFKYKFYWHNETPFNEPDSLLEEIDKNQGFIGIKYHAFRILKFQDPTLKLWDPKDDSIKTKDYSILLKNLEKDDGGFGLIKKLD